MTNNNSINENAVLRRITNEITMRSRWTARHWPLIPAADGVSREVLAEVRFEGDFFTVQYLGNPDFMHLKSQINHLF